MYVQIPALREQIYFLRSRVSTVFRASVWPNHLEQFETTVRELHKDQIHRLRDDQLLIMDYTTYFCPHVVNRSQRLFSAGYNLDVLLLAGSRNVYEAWAITKERVTEMLAREPLNLQGRKKLEAVLQEVSVEDLPQRYTYHHQYNVRPEFIMNLVARMGTRTSIPDGMKQFRAARKQEIV